MDGSCAPTLSGGLGHGMQGGAHLRMRSADQRRQQRGGAEPAMGRDHARYGGRRRRIVEEDIASAIDLQVDEARRQPRTGRRDMHRNCGRQLATRGNCGDAALVDDDRAVTVENVAVEH
jgi:hypothetical protein